MSLKIPVYATRVTSLSDARYFAGMGVRFIGICADPQSQDYFSPERFREIAGWVSGPEFVLEAERLPDSSLSEIAGAYGVSLLRISPEQISHGLRQGLRYGVYGDADSASGAEFIVTSTMSGGHHDVLTFVDGVNMVPGLEELLRQHPGAGLVVSGTPEQAAGLKDYDSRELLEYLDAD